MRQYDFMEGAHFRYVRKNEDSKSRITKERLRTIPKEEKWWIGRRVIKVRWEI